jgi:serine/threonine protein kinase/formylglycine-generating enzyme required for sulfatase activity
LYRLHGVASPEALAKELVGQTSAFMPNVSRFDVKDEIGSGSQGSIIRIHDRDAHRDVALKTLKHQKPDLDEVSRFIHEAQITAQLEHPGIVPVHDIGVLADGTVYYTMKRIEGESLADRLARDGGKPEQRVELISLFLRACEAMAFAHSRNVIHRDLKPRNIMLGAFGEVMVLDWGLAKVVGSGYVPHDRVREAPSPESDGDIHRTMDGYAVGTPAYMSPEQAQGSSSTLVVDQRCDIYALGVILYEIVSGVSPYQRGNIRGTLEQAAQGRWMPLDQQPKGTELPRPLVAIVHKAMSHNPALRYQNVAELVDDLRRFLRGSAVHAYREPLLESLCRHMRNHRRLVTAVSVTMGCGLLAVSAWRWHEWSQQSIRLAQWHAEAAAAERNHDPETARRALELIIAQDPSDLVARDQLDVVKDELRVQADLRMQAQKRDEAAALVAKARQQERLGSEDALRLASESYLKALGLTPGAPDLVEALRRVAERQAVIDGQRRQQEIASAQDLERRTQAEKLITESRHQAESEHLQEALGLMQAAIALHATSEQELTYYRDLAVRYQRQQESQLRIQRRIEADHLLEGVREALRRNDVELARRRLVQMEAADREHPALVDATREVVQAERKVAEGRAQGCLGQAQGIWTHLDADRSRLAEARARLREGKVRLLEQGDASVRAELHRLDLECRGLEASLASGHVEVVKLFDQAMALAPGFAPVRDALADYYAARLVQEDLAGNEGEAAMAGAQARIYDDRSRYGDVLNGIATVSCPAKASALSLRLIEERDDLRMVAGDPVITIAPGNSVRIAAGHYEVRTADGVVCAHLFRRGQGYVVDHGSMPTLPAEGVFVPAGIVHSAVAVITVPAFVITRHEITCGDWLEFLNDPPILARYQAERAKGNLILAPRPTFDSQEPSWRQRAMPVWSREPGGFLLETTSGVAVSARRPVTGISWEDAVAYAEWRAERDHLSWRLPRPEEWTLAAEGGDGRPYPWGQHPDLTGCASGLQAERWAHELEVGAVPTDISVQGVMDLAGSVSEFAAGIGASPRLRVVMGGSYLDRSPTRFAADGRRELDQRAVNPAVGVRLVFTPSR